MASVRSVILSTSLDPVSSPGEVLFGLIMTLTFTLGAGLTLQEEGRERARQLLIAAIGGHLAWGVAGGGGATPPSGRGSPDWPSCSVGWRWSRRRSPWEDDPRE